MLLATVLKTLRFMVIILSLSFLTGIGWFIITQKLELYNLAALEG